MNDIPLVATDLDGTLLDYRTRSVPAGFGAMLDRVLAAGAAFAVASGRLDPETPPRAAEATKPPRRGTRRGRFQTSASDGMQIQQTT